MLARDKHVAIAKLIVHPWSQSFFSGLWHFYFWVSQAITRHEMMTANAGISDDVLGPVGALKSLQPQAPPVFLKWPPRIDNNFCPFPFRFVHKYTQQEDMFILFDTFQNTRNSTHTHTHKNLHGHTQQSVHNFWWRIARIGLCTHFYIEKQLFIIA